jgi:hypothetical protein
MISDALSRPTGDEAARILAIAITLVLAGLLAGGAELLAAARNQKNRPHAETMHTLVSATVCSLTCPLFLTVVSSNLLNDGSPLADALLRLFCVTLGYTLILRRLLLWSPRPDVARGRSRERRLTLLDVEILRAVERSSLREGSLPEIPEDLRVSPSVLTLKMRALMDGGLIGVRQTESSRQEIFLTAAGWSRLNAALSDQLW